VLALSIDQVVAWGVLYYAYNVLSQPIATSLDVSRGFVAGAFSLTLLVSGWLARRVGHLLDQVGARSVLILGAIVGPIAMGSLALAHGPTSLLAGFIALGLAQAVALYEPAFRAIVDWFPEERGRSRALLLLTSIGGFASTIFLPATTALVAHVGWRGGTAILAGGLALVAIPISLHLPRTARHERVTRSHSADRSRAAALLAAAFAIQSFASTGALIYLIWHLVERGMSAESAAAIAGLAGAAQVPGRLVLAAIQRAVPSQHRIPLLFLAQATALVGIATAGPSIATVCVVVFGAASGMMTLERVAIAAEWYGRDSFGARSGRIVSAVFVARAMSPFAVEALHRHMSYASAFLVLATVIATGAFAMRLAAQARAAGR